MAGRIKGITVEIGGDTTGLERALKNVNSTECQHPSLPLFFRRYGYLLAEEGKNLASYACYQYSLGFESSDLARGEIEYLSSIMREDLSKYDPEEIMKKNDIPFLESMPELDALENS